MYTTRVLLYIHSETQPELRSTKPAPNLGLVALAVGEEVVVDDPEDVGTDGLQLLLNLGLVLTDELKLVSLLNTSDRTRGNITLPLRSPAVSIQQHAGISARVESRSSSRQRRWGTRYVRETVTVGQL